MAVITRSALPWCLLLAAAVSNCRSMRLPHGAASQHQTKAGFGGAPATADPLSAVISADPASAARKEEAEHEQAVLLDELFSGTWGAFILRDGSELSSKSSATEDDPELYVASADEDEEIFDDKEGVLDDPQVYPTELPPVDDSSVLSASPEEGLLARPSNALTHDAPAALMIDPSGIGKMPGSKVEHHRGYGLVDTSYKAASSNTQRRRSHEPAATGDRDSNKLQRQAATSQATSSSDLLPKTSLTSTEIFHRLPHRFEGNQMDAALVTKAADTFPHFGHWGRFLPNVPEPTSSKKAALAGRGAQEQWGRSGHSSHQRGGPTDSSESDLALQQLQYQKTQHQPELALEVARLRTDVAGSDHTDNADKHMWHQAPTKQASDGSRRQPPRGARHEEEAQPLPSDRGRGNVPEDSRPAAKTGDVFLLPRRRRPSLRLRPSESSWTVAQDYDPTATGMAFSTITPRHGKIEKSKSRVIIEGRFVA